LIQSRYTVKILLLSSVPVLLALALSIGMLHYSVTQLTQNASGVADNGVEKIYRDNLERESRDISEKIQLKFAALRAELKIIAGVSQQLIDNKNTSEILGDRLQKIDFFKNHFVYDPNMNWSTLVQDETDVTMNVWGYLHDNKGNINQQTTSYVNRMSFMKVILNAVKQQGVEKSWVYLIGGKKTPVIIMSPWANIPKDSYLGQNEHNWWDFFFPNIVEGWQSWAKNPLLKEKLAGDEITFTPLYKDAGGTGLMITLFQPLWTKDRTDNEGATGIDYNIDNLIAMVNNEVIGESGFAFLLQGDTSVLAINEEQADILGVQSAIKTQSGVERLEYKLINSEVTDLKNIAVNLFSRSDVTTHNIRTGNKEYLVTFQKVFEYNLWTEKGISRFPLYLGLIVPKEEIYSIRNDIRLAISDASAEALRTILPASILIGILAAVTSMFFVFRETKQIRLMTKAMTSVKEVDLITQVEVVSKDELGHLALTFNKMVETLHKNHNKLKFYAENLEKKVVSRTLHLQSANKELERLNTLDALTQLYNRGFFEERLIELWRSFERNKKPLSLLMIDLDFFKEYNDTYGHPAGDDCLRQVSKVMQHSATRPFDVVARYGGEEFCVILTCDADGAMLVSKNILEEIEKLSIVHTGSDTGVVSVSIGVSSLIPDNYLTPKYFIALADEALYKSKRNGRHRVTLAKKDDVNNNSAAKGK
jgi:phosphoserine phosphatase RsbU/P